MRLLPVLVGLLVLTSHAQAQAGRIPGPVSSRLLAKSQGPRTGLWLREDSGLPVTGMAIGAGLLGGLVLICAVDGEPDGDYFDCNLRSILASAAVGALLGGLIEGLVSPAQPRETTGSSAISASFRRDLRQRTSLASKVPWAGLVIGGALGWGVGNALCYEGDCTDGKLQVAMVGALIGGTAQLFLR